MSDLPIRFNKSNLLKKNCTNIKGSEPFDVRVKLLNGRKNNVNVTVTPGQKIGYLREQIEKEVKLSSNSKYNLLFMGEVLDETKTFEDYA